MRASDIAYRSLRADIIDGELPPGTVLAEVEQAARLGISRTPLREALSRLSSEGLTTPHQGRGVVVTDISLDQLEDLFAVRLPLECAAVELATARADPEIFTELAERFASASRLIDAGGTTQHGYYALVGELDAAIDLAVANPYLLQAQRQLRTHLVRIRRLSHDNPDRLLTSAAEHAQIACAIAARDPRLAVAATQVHLHNSLRHLLASAQHSRPSVSREDILHG